MGELDCEYQTTEGTRVTRERGLALDHIFNHSTHHRGQLTAALTQNQLTDYCIDLTYSPAVDV
eukprot:NODE_11188_length_265_cov_29.750000_g9418_i0.p1 GENE.NODE_11188_length_265_cov_29.750000_g9418_i0~~NODE_11188_length_265_cov_29.750000_g9418_i0.p1  ORF type:complete len:71 (+),score=14.66 NODE_11188_length_265_cov_29.750000_g9418_i0:26-214(+)